MLSSRRLVAVVSGIALVFAGLVAASPAQAVGTGELGGTFTAPADATPFVEVFQLQGEDFVSLGAVAPLADKTWNFDELAAGQYRVSFIDNKDDALYTTIFASNIVTDNPDDERITTFTLAEGQKILDIDGELKIISLTDMPTPVLDGKAVVGGSLYADLNEWEVSNSVGIGYSWTRNGTEVADGDTYELTKNDLNAKIQVTVSVDEPGFSAPTKSSDTVTIKPGALKSAKPKIKGQAIVGATLKVVTGKWKPAKISYSYKWYAGKTLIKKAGVRKVC